MLKIRNLFFFILIFLLFSNSILALNYGKSEYSRGKYSTGEVVYSSSSYCGDGICNNDETCSSCPEDCGKCPSGGGNPYKSIDSHLKIDKSEIGIFKFWSLLSIRKINLTAKENIHSPKIVVEWLNSDSDKKEIPQLIKDNLIYHYEKITPYNFNDSSIKDMIISFRIRNKWLKDNNLKVEDIVLRRYTYHWVELDTIFIKEKDGYSYFEAKSPGFSYFAIGNKLEIQKPGENFTTQKDTYKNKKKPIIRTYILIIFIVIGFSIISIIIFFLKRRFYTKILKTKSKIKNNKKLNYLKRLPIFF